MKGTLLLKNGILINGEPVKEMDYDTEAITGELFVEMESKHRASTGFKNIAMCEVDHGLHLYMGYAAIIAVNPSYDLADLLRMKGADVAAVLRIGRNFINPPGSSQEEDSEKPSETTQESTIQGRENSGKEK